MAGSGGRAEQVERGDPCERTHFVKHGGAALQKKVLDHTQRSRGQVLEDTESKTFGNHLRVDPIEDRVGPCASHPQGAAGRGVHTAARLCGSTPGAASRAPKWCAGEV